MKKNLEAAFARPYSEDKDFIHLAQSGMTLRDYFAAKAMQGLLSDGVGKNSDIHIIASDAYFVADAMIRVRDL